MARRPFFVGVGAQRAGTTWIGHFLRRLPDVRFSPIKETCFFDSKYTEARKNQLHIPINTRLAVLGLGNYTRRNPISGAKLWYHYWGIRRLRDASYRAYFDELARTGCVTGEITPSYAMLDPAAIARVEAVLDQPNYFFVMRNPVDRLLSQYSFLSSRPGLKAPEGKDLAEALFTLASESIHIDYAKSLAAYQGAVPPDRFLTLFTEHLFDPDRAQGECDRLCDFLGIGRAAAPARRDVNRAPKIDISPEVRAGLAAKLEAAYRSGADLMGDDLPVSWRNDLALIEQS